MISDNICILCVCDIIWYLYTICVCDIIRYLYTLRVWYHMLPVYSVCVISCYIDIVCVCDIIWYLYTLWTCELCVCDGMAWVSLWSQEIPEPWLMTYSWPSVFMGKVLTYSPQLPYWDIRVSQTTFTQLGQLWQIEQIKISYIILSLFWPYPSHLKSDLNGI